MGWNIQAVTAACLLWQMVNYIPSYFKWHPLGIIVLTLSWGSNQRRGWRRRSRFHTRFLPTPLASFPEPCSIQPALLFTTSASCPRPGHVTWLAATGSQREFKSQEKYLSESEQLSLVIQGPVWERSGCRSGSHRSGEGSCVTGSEFFPFLSFSPFLLFLFLFFFFSPRPE